MYMVLDGRANFDTDKACVLEALEESDDEKDARIEAYWEKHYKNDGMDSCLVRYDVTGEAITNPIVINSTSWED